MKMHICAAVVAAVAGFAVTSVQAAPLIYVDDFMVANQTALMTLPGNATSITRLDTGINTLDTIGGSRQVILERATGTIYKGAIHPQSGIGQDENDQYVFSVAAPSDFQPKATLTYGLTEPAGMDLKDHEFNFELVSFDAPGGGSLSLDVVITGTNSTVETYTIPAVGLGLNHILQSNFSDAVLTSVDTISFVFTGTAGADFSITAIGVGIPEPTALVGLLPIAGLLRRSRR